MEFDQVPPATQQESVDCPPATITLMNPARGKDLANWQEPVLSCQPEPYTYQGITQTISPGKETFFIVGGEDKGLVTLDSAPLLLGLAAAGIAIKIALDRKFRTRLVQSANSLSNSAQ